MTEYSLSSWRTTCCRSTLPTLAGTVVAFVALNSLLLTLSRVRSVENSFVAYVMLGMAIVQPILFGMWTALATGPVLQQLMAVAPCVMLSLVIPMHFSPDKDRLLQRDFLAVASATWSIFAASLLLFSIFRFCRFRIRHTAIQPDHSTSNFHFGIKHLLVLMTAYAAALGFTAGLTFRPEPETTFPNFFGPNFVFFIAFFWGGLLSAAALPTSAIPLAILHEYPSRPAIQLAIAFWLIVTLALGLFLYGEEGPIVFAVVLLAQLGAAITGTLTALALRRAGVRLVR